MDTYKLKLAFTCYKKDYLKWAAFYYVAICLALTYVMVPVVVRAIHSETLHAIRQGKTPEIRALFSFKFYFQYASTFLVLSLCITAGFVLVYIPGILLLTWWLYSLFYLSDGKPFYEALAESKSSVVRDGDFLKHLSVIAVVLGLNTAGVLGGGVFILFTLPYSIIYLGLSYLEIVEPLEGSQHEEIIEAVVSKRSCTP